MWTKFTPRIVPTEMLCKDIFGEQRSCQDTQLMFIRQIPHPSEDPQDSLNWSKSWKCEYQDSECHGATRLLQQKPDLVITTQFLYIFVTVESALSMAPMFPLLAEEFHLDETQLCLLTGACVLALGYANFIIVPCSKVFWIEVSLLVKN